MLEGQGDNRPIGVFDSGVGGLTVLDAIHRLLPNEHLVYLGDTARVPYGTKSSDSVVKYACQAAEALVVKDIKALVIACNTASASALPKLCETYPDIPVIGVVVPGAEASVRQTSSHHVGVIATEGTINNGAYHREIAARLPSATVKGVACSLFVALAEEGWCDGDLVESIVAKCLTPILDDAQIDTLVLGCTHFPALKGAIANVVGEKVALVDSAQTTAMSLKASLADKAMLADAAQVADVAFMVTDGVERFSRVAKHFISIPVKPSSVQLVDV